MTLYLDSSALLKRYIDEPDSDHFDDILRSDPDWLTCRVTWVEVWRNLGRRLTASGRATLSRRPLPSGRRVARA